mmetsp:Transcript_6444/g.19044  ORF Transcript_6444/g.19044 Transcript_6444/m.19044 type:complete len:88 (-) Transcript_6444:39-302(-)
MGKVQVTATPAGAILVKKGPSLKSALRSFGWGATFGGAVGFTTGFSVAQAIYSDERERDQVKRVAKITIGAAAGALVLGALGSLARR